MIYLNGTQFINTKDYANCSKLKDNDRSIVFHSGDEVFKIYNKYEQKKCKLSSNIYQVLRSIDNQNIMKILEVYYRDYISYILSYIHPKKRVDAYRAKYYVSSSDNILERPTDFLLENINSIEKLFSILASERIKPNDVNPHNTIITSELIVIIDPDSFSFEKIEDLEMVNKEILLEYILKILSWYGVRFYLAIDRLCAMNIENESSVTSVLSKRLKGFKTPIDCLRKINKEIS